MPDSKQSFMTRILNKFSYSQKFFLISLLFAASIIVPAYFMIRLQNERITAAKLELRGNQYERSLRNLLESLSDHKLISNRFFNQNIGEKSEMTGLESQISSEFKNLILINADFQNDLKKKDEDIQDFQVPFERPEELEKKWEELVKHIFEYSPEVNIAEQDAIISNVRTLFLQAADASEKNTDPANESNNLARLAIYDLPRAQELISQILVKGENFLKKKNETPEEKINLIILIALLEDNLSTIKTLAAKAFANQRLPYDKSEVGIKLKEPLRQYLEDSQDFLKLTKKWIIQSESDPNPNDFFTLGSRALKSSFTFWDGLIDQLDHLLYKQIEKYTLRQRLSVAALFLCASLGFLLGYLVINEISKPLEKLVEAAKHLASGDLSTRVPVTYTDEVGQVSIAFNQMAEAFQELIGQLQWTGIQLTTSTTEIAAAAKQQEATVVEQEATTKQIAVTAREISSTSKEFAKTMNDVSTSAEQASALAASGKAGLNRMETIMRQMVDASQNIASKLAVLNEKAGNITSVITTITKVADQTNLLSLNAAIEAEKAGEHGRSFSVIAREIRRLADQTANATLDIEKMVNEMVSAVSAGVMGVDKFSEEIHSGVNQVAIVSEQLSKIIEQVQQQTESFENVNQGMQAQTQGAEQINESINQLSEAAQQTTESIRQFHNAIEQLNNAAQDMQTAVSKIKR